MSPASPYFIRWQHHHLRRIFYFGLILVMMSMPSALPACFVGRTSRVEFYRQLVLSNAKHVSFRMAKGPDGDRRIYNKDQQLATRRTFILAPSISILASMLPMYPSNAACLPGDIRTDCIGVYKMPLDDAALNYVETPEQLKKFAPDLNWVPPIEYPSTYSAAVTQIKQQREQLDTVKDLISRGDLNQGGLVLLDVVPKISSSGKVIMKSFDTALNKERNLEMKQRAKRGNQTSDGAKSTTIDMKAYRFEYALNEVLGYLGETDVLIGQGLRGQLGVSAPAQLQILSSLDEAKREFDEMLRVIPEKI